MTTKSIRLGPLEFKGRPIPGGIKVTFRVAGDRITWPMTNAEWLSLQEAASTLLRAEARAEECEGLRAEVERLKAKLHDRCSCEHGDASAPLVKHDKDCPIRVNVRTRIAPEVAISRLAAALDDGEELDDLKEQLDRAREAAKVLATRIDDLGAFVDDTDPRIMATAGPLGEAERDLFEALGLDCDAEAARQRADIESRCAVCGWPLAERIEDGCTRGNCSYRPRPAVLYAPERAARESHPTPEGER